jgi:LacI family fructose operon transcriptional repressor
MSQPRKATIHDIARLSGMSPSTVSAALSGSWKERRISEAKVEAIRRIAAEQGYAPNLQARGLRTARSGLVGLVIPVHDNRFFTSMSQSFEMLARDRGLVPVIASSLRDPSEELRIVETLASYAVEKVFIAGVTDAEAVASLCRQTGLRHVFVDLPAQSAPSVVSDNRRGAAELTEKLLSEAQGLTGQGRGRLFILGGQAADAATTRRIDGFRETLAAHGMPPAPDQIIATGYAPSLATREMAALLDRLGGPPAGLFVNSLTVFEGVLGHVVTLPPEPFATTVIGCYDYDPFAAYLAFPVHMVRQNAHGLIAEAWRLIESDTPGPALVEVPPELIPPRTIYKGLFGETG